MRARAHSRLEGAQEAEGAQLRLAGEARDGVRLVRLGRHAPRRGRGAGEVARADLRQRRLGVDAQRKAGEGERGLLRRLRLGERPRRAGGKRCSAARRRQARDREVGPARAGIRRDALKERRPELE